MIYEKNRLVQKLISKNAFTSKFPTTKSLNFSEKLHFFGRPTKKFDLTEINIPIIGVKRAKQSKFFGCILKFTYMNYEYKINTHTKLFT